MNHGLATTNLEFFGILMQQNNLAMPALNRLLQFVRPKKIIEIGAANCGLTFFLALYAYITGGKLHTYDTVHVNHKQEEMLKLVGAELTIGDCLNESNDPNNNQTVDFIKQTIESPGKNLIVCDAGKALEFNLYVPHCKSGDVLITHDYSPTFETFEKEIKGKFWNWQENWDERVEESCKKYGLVKIMEEDLNPAVWGGWMKA